MSDSYLTERIREAGDSGDAPSHDLTADSVRRVSQARRSRHRRKVGIATMTATAVAACIGTGVAIARSSDGTADPGTEAGPGKPRVASLMPGCPPALPTLADSNVKDAQGLGVQAGQTHQLRMDVPPSPPDRRLEIVTIIVATDRAALASLNDVGSPSKQIATAKLSEIVTGEVVIELQVPRETPPGTYPIVAVGTFPGPALCGVENKPDATTDGVIYGELGQLIVR